MTQITCYKSLTHVVLNKSGHDLNLAMKGTDCISTCKFNNTTVTVLKTLVF